MHTFWKSSLLPACLFLLIACSNPDTPAPTTVPPSPTALSAAAPGENAGTNSGGSIHTH